MNKKTYVLGMFPYPSGEGLHVGHVRIFTACDVMARYFRMKTLPDTNVSYPLGSSRALGFPREHSVLSPMGWDAFGLPAENAAIKNKKIPQEMVPHNYANFKKQMQNLSLDFDWEREFATTDPSYYAITQWIFLQLYNKKDQNGKRLVYREKVPINWCPKCKTGLANEEVLGDGTHERCGEVVTKKLLPQWVMRITSYAERLLTDLDIDLKIEGKKLDSARKGLDWPKGILEMQRNWIGKKEGIEIVYRIANKEYSEDAITVFTTTPVNFGATFMVVAPEHTLVKKIIDGEYVVDEKIRSDVKDYLVSTQQKSEVDRMVEGKEKTGVFTGIYVKNHVTGEEMPVWTSDFALAHVGTGALQGCPGHDRRDFEFASKFGIPIKRVVVGEDGDESPIEKIEQVIEKGTKGKMINSDFLNGIDFSQAMNKTMDYFEDKGWGQRTTTYHLRDWVFSRQRYWGEPIPLVYCANCAKDKEQPNRNMEYGKDFEVVDKDGEMMAVVPLPETELPLELPLLDSYEPTDTGESPLSRVTEWVNTKCPNCGGPAKRETDTMPNWAGSCWYFLAFAFWKTDLKVSKSGSHPYTDWWMKMALPEIKKWLPVDWYLGGAEHAVLHLLYARFWVKVLQDLGLLDFPEPFLRLRSVGLVLAEDGKKMSKSIGNVVNPDDMVAKYGSDAVRMYEMFMGPWEQSIAWDSGAISGQVRFLGRIKETVKKNKEHWTKEDGGESSPELAAKLKDLVIRVEEGVLNQKFNTSIAGLMEFVNKWREPGMALSSEHLEMFASLLSLFAPITAEEIVQLCHSDTVSQREATWPDVKSFDSLALAQDLRVTIAVQVNGKLRSTVEVSNQEAGNQESVMKIVMEDEKVKKWLVGVVKKTIFVPGKLVNLVL